MNLIDNSLEGKIFIIFLILVDFRFLHIILSNSIHLSHSAPQMCSN